ncbi:unnamed protein product [Bursaphelenchus xylophilus]|uniref:(pine wood nematode) hypothetical protein n=1 Tax=Bursaphelenchus xylophilus TaxID=6326 RepID=A0A1I7SBP2_BURXY|nr:unnamed protein product [Bursaphelenchus xylophilus]CAG9114536.1 unnamed protein product [Bursaphelenchus xylophilus]
MTTDSKLSAAFVSDESKVMLCSPKQVEETADNTFLSVELNDNNRAQTPSSQRAVRISISDKDSDNRSIEKAPRFKRLHLYLLIISFILVFLLIALCYYYS